MLKQLTIQNYALIERTELDLAEGMSVITGETGAGKSIMLGALGLLLGQKTDARSFRIKRKSASSRQRSTLRHTLSSIFLRMLTLTTPTRP